MGFEIVLCAWLLLGRLGTGSFVYATLVEGPQDRVGGAEQGPLAQSTVYSGITHWSWYVF
ncbi:hypothetical protein K491DRAFT_697372, partial [Lophiostoma macrostomum CBS 122681]